MLQGSLFSRPQHMQPERVSRVDLIWYGFCLYPQYNKFKKAMYFLWYLLIGLAAGWIANLIVKGNGDGLIVNLIVGLIGGLLGGWLVSLFGWIPVGTVGTLLTSVIGAIILLCIVSLFTRRKVNTH